MLQVYEMFQVYEMVQAEVLFQRCSRVFHDFCISTTTVCYEFTVRRPEYVHVVHFQFNFEYWINLEAPKSSFSLSKFGKISSKFGNFFPKIARNGLEMSPKLTGCAIFLLNQPFLI